MVANRKMVNRAAREKRKFSQVIPLVIIGMGLIFIGLVFVNLLIKNRSSDRFSVTPSKVDFPAPELTLNNLSGDKVSISDYREHVVLINNWATWCPPCRAEMPTLARYFEKYNQKGFMLIGINAGDPSNDVSKFVSEYELTFPILLDPNNRSLLAFHNDGLPSSYVINRNGTVVLAWTGPINQEMLEKYVTPLLEQ